MANVPILGAWILTPLSRCIRPRRQLNPQRLHHCQRSLQRRIPLLVWCGVHPRPAVGPIARARTGSPAKFHRTGPEVCENGLLPGVSERPFLTASAGRAIVQNAIFNHEAPQPASSPKKRWLSYASIFCLISASTAVMMLCPCDVVGIHHYYAISLVALASLFGIAAVYLVYRRMSRDSGITAFLRAVIALAIVGVSVYAELLIAMKIVALLASRR